MKRIISLIKVLFKTNINSSSNKKKKTQILLWIGFGIYILFIFINFWKSYIDPLKIMGQQDVAINLVLGFSSILIFVTSITYIVNILYFTNDMENIIPFPFKPREIFAAKIIIAYLYELMIASMLALPGFISYGIELKLNVLYYITAFWVFLFIPVMPVIFLTIFYTLFMQFFKVSRFKNLFKIISTVIILVAVLSFEMQMNANMLENGDYDGYYIYEMSMNFQKQMPYYLKVASGAIKNVGTLSSIVSLLWYILINLGIAIITIFALDKLYLRGVRNNTDTVIKKSDSKNIIIKFSSKWQSMVLKEMKSLLRNVTFFIQCVLPTSFMPAVILATMMTSKVNTEVEMNLNENHILKMLFGILVIQFFMMMNQISSTAISRDGEEEASFLKTLPMSKMKQFSAKAMPSIFIGLFNLCIAMIFNINLFELTWIDFIHLTIIGVLLNVIQSYWFLLIDLKNPKLKWESEVAVVRHNVNTLKSIMLWFLVIILTALIGNIFLIFVGKYFEIAYILLLIILCLVIKEYLSKNIEKLYEKV